MKNKEFYEIMQEMGNWMGNIEFEGRTIYPFNYVFCRFGMPEDSFIADYNENCDYKRIFLSWYYYTCYSNTELDYKGNDCASAASKEEEYKATELLKERDNLKKYIAHISHYSDYERLVEKYDLVKI